MNARELHDFLKGSIWLVAPEESNQSTILRALDLLARTEESTDELVRELQRMALPDPHDERDVPHAPLCRKAASALVALRAERDSLKAHAEAMAHLIEDGTGDSVWLAAVAAYRAAHPKDAP